MVSSLPSLYNTEFCPFLHEWSLPSTFPSHSNMAVLKCKWDGLAHEDTHLPETRLELLVNKLQMKYSKLSLQIS